MSLKEYSQGTELDYCLSAVAGCECVSFVGVGVGGFICVFCKASVPPKLQSHWPSHASVYVPCHDWMLGVKQWEGAYSKLLTLLSETLRPVCEKMCKNFIYFCWGPLHNFCFYTMCFGSSDCGILLWAKCYHHITLINKGGIELGNQVILVLRHTCWTASIVPVALSINLYPVGGRKLGIIQNILKAHPQYPHLYPTYVLTHVSQCVKWYSPHRWIMFFFLFFFTKAQANAMVLCFFSLFNIFISEVDNFPFYEWISPVMKFIFQWICIISMHYAVTLSVWDGAGPETQ